MADVIKLSESAVVDIAPSERGDPVVVDGRLIPRLRAAHIGDVTELILDGRLSYNVPRDLSKLVAAAMANSMAVGAGYASVSADSPEPFAPEVCEIHMPNQEARDDG